MRFRSFAVILCRLPVLAVLPAGAHPDIFLYFVVGQLPIYLWPAILAPVYRRLLQK